MARVLLVLIAAAAAALAYLLFWPADIEPVAWQPPDSPGYSGPYRSNTVLQAAERLGDWPGPEDIAVDIRGRIYTGLADGRVMRIDTDGNNELLAETGGRPIGIALGPDETVYVADAITGLLAIRANQELEVLSTEADGIPFRFADGIDVGPDGTVYFTDASSKHGLDEVTKDIVEHAGRGRLLAYEPSRGETRTLLDGLNFANGVVLGPEGRYLLVVETGSYRVLRYWLQGEQAGTSEVFIDNLPGFPDNISFNGHDRFWLALFAPRNEAVDALGPYPLLRGALLRLPEAVKPAPAHHAHVVGLSLDGEVVASLQDDTPDAYAPITAAEEYEGRLILGSLEHPGIAWFKLP